MHSKVATPFDLPGRFYRGNLHTHSTMSDGVLSPAELAERYKSQGYDFLVISDHFWERFGWPVTDTRDLRDADFTTIIGAELHTPETTHWETWHILAVGLPLDFAPAAPGETGAEIARRAAKAGAFIGIAHPAWFPLTIEDANTIDVAHAVEVYNHNCELGFARGNGMNYFDILLAQGRKLTAYAVDDAHFKVDDAFGGWVNVRAESLDPDALLAALKAGDYYASQGPEINSVRIESGHIHLTCSPVNRVAAAWKGRYAASALGDNMTEVSLDMKTLGEAEFVIITLTDAQGRKAWTNPIWLHGD